MSMQSPLDPMGPQAARIFSEWWLYFYVCLAVYLLVGGFYVYIFLFRRSSPPGSGYTGPGSERPHDLNRRLGRHVMIASVLTGVVLFGLLIASVITGSNLSAYSARAHRTIEVTGHQWWWEVRYDNNNDPSRSVTTANEIHVPAGEPVMLRLTSDDVIHSFWVPNLNGKRDLIPGRITQLVIHADKPGIFRGQCAEFCGLQHAHMALLVIAEPPDKFSAWMDQQVQPAREPVDPSEQRGRQVFLAGPCVLCHSIRGTAANGLVAPDLTHVGSRRMIAAGTLPNTPGHLAGWIADNQTIKPGNHMPQIALKSEDLQPLLYYLESLK
jgi:cytochrome c oxidase subunit II